MPKKVWQITIHCHIGGLLCIGFKEEFEAIFKDTYILKNRTKEASSYMVLRFDFSAIDIYNCRREF